MIKKKKLSFDVNLNTNSQYTFQYIFEKFSPISLLPSI